MEQKKQETIIIRDLRKKNKFFIDDFYLDHYAKKCGVHATGVYLSLCRHANKEQCCWPSQKKIAEELDISPKQVYRSIKILVKWNIVKKIRLGKKLNNRYLLIDKSEWTDSPITMDRQSLQTETDSPFHSKDTHIRIQKRKEGFSFPEKRKPFFRGMEMRKAQGRWWCLPINGVDVWLEFAGKESDIVWLTDKEFSDEMLKIFSDFKE